MNAQFHAIIDYVSDGFAEALRPETTLGELGFNPSAVEDLVKALQREFQVDLGRTGWSRATAIATVAAAVHAAGVSQ